MNPFAPTRRRFLQGTVAASALVGSARSDRPRRRPGGGPRALPIGQDRLAAGLRRDDHGRRHPGELLRQPDRGGSAVRGAHRGHRPLREDSAGADPPEGRHRSHVEDRHLRDPRRRPDVLRALRGQQMGRAARRLHGRCVADGPGLVQARRHRAGLAQRQQRRRKAPRRSLRRRGHPAGLPQGPLRGEGAEAGRRPSGLRGERRGGSRSQQPRLGRRPARPRRRRPERLHLLVDLPRVRRRMVQGRPHHRQRPRGRGGAHLVRRPDAQIRAGGGPELELARHRRRLLAGHDRHLYRRAFLGLGRQQPREVEGHRQGRLRALAERAVGQARHLDLELGLSRSTPPCPTSARRPPGSSSSGRRARRRRRARRTSSPGPPSAPASTACRSGAIRTT